MIRHLFTAHTCYMCGNVMVSLSIGRRREIQIVCTVMLYLVLPVHVIENQVWSIIIAGIRHINFTFFFSIFYWLRVPKYFCILNLMSVKMSNTLVALLFLGNYGDQRVLKFKIIINVSLSSCRFIWIPICYRSKTIINMFTLTVGL